MNFNFSIRDNQDDIYYLETKYGKNNLHNIIKSNRSYKNKIQLCKNCQQSMLYLSKIEDKYGELIDRYIVELESLKNILDIDIDRNELKKDIKNLYKEKLNAYKTSLIYLMEYKKQICNNRRKKLECYTINDNINQIIHKINITNIELVYILLNILNKDVTEILSLLNEYKLTYNSKIFIKVKEIEKENIQIENFKNINKKNKNKNKNLIIFLIILLLLLFKVL